MALRLSSCRMLAPKRTLPRSSKERKKNPDIVSRRLPAAARRLKGIKITRQDTTTLLETSPPEIFRRVQLAAQNYNRSPALWTNLAKQVLRNMHELLPIHQAEILQYFASIGFRHEQVCTVLANNLMTNSTLRSSVTALLALHKLRLDNLVNRMKADFMHQLVDKLNTLEWGDIRRVLICCARLEITNKEFVAKAMKAMCVALKTWRVTICKMEEERLIAIRKHKNIPEMPDAPNPWCPDCREFFILPYIMYKTNCVHKALLNLARWKIMGTISSRIRVAPLEAVQTLQGFSHSLETETNETSKEHYQIAKDKLVNYLAFLLAESDMKTFLQTGSGIRTLKINNTEIWNIWGDEAEHRAPDLNVSQLKNIIQIFKILDRRTNSLMLQLHKKDPKAGLEVAEEVDTGLRGHPSKKRAKGYLRWKERIQKCNAEKDTLKGNDLNESKETETPIKEDKSPTFEERQISLAHENVLF
eukprot:Platyproteum_vivax@DN783_c0_g1_i1.p1